MSKEEIFEELKFIRDMLMGVVEKNYNHTILRDRLQELIWRVGEDIGEF